MNVWTQKLLTGIPESGIRKRMGRFLLDVRVPISSALIFLAVYSLVLCIPLFLYWKGHHLAAFLSSIAFATPAPLVYSRLNRHAVDRILVMEKTYHHVLIQASRGLNRWKTVEEITGSIVAILFKAMRIRSAAFYLFDGQRFVLKDTAGDSASYARELAADAPTFLFRKSFSSAVILDDCGQDGKVLEGCPASVAVGIARGEQMTGVLFLGEKVSLAPYSDRDLSVFNVIAEQTALAIENAMHLEVSKKDFLQQMHDRRLKDIGVLGSTVSHQICNRFNIMTLGADVIRLKFFNEDVLANAPREQLVENAREVIRKVDLIAQSAKKGAEISDAFKTFSKGGTDFSGVTLKRIVHIAKEIVDVKHKNYPYEFVEEYDENIVLWVNASMIQDVLFNAFDNSIDAMKNKADHVEQGDFTVSDYRPRITLGARTDGDRAVIELVDNGKGFKAEELERVFIPFFTTKGLEQGTGLGLHAMRELVARNSGTIAITSECGNWAKVTLTLPLAKEGKICA
ncbi:MAG: GAF domain-containing protein [Candidatus Omnitrophica bacterium]|nr:GAF domain-containing protein [Candidatus Omnitrophota bacterium]